MASKTERYLALLRGINVGGNNIIGKDDLAACFEDLGCTNVRTYIQSGNILFRSDVGSVKQLVVDVEAALSKRFNYDAQAVVITRRKYKSALDAAPAGWGELEDQKHNVMFTLRSTTPRKVLAQLDPPKADIETVTIGPGVLFWSAAKDTLTKTTLMKLAKAAVYRQVTVRNHNTAFKLLELFDEI